MICSGCDYKKNAPEGICSVLKGSDGLPVRCVGLWAKDKYFYLGRYLDIFTTSMKNIWRGELYYIDLFAGSGKCKVRETGEEIDGSALISLSVKYPFKRYFLVELDPDAASALKKRVEKSPIKNRVHIIQGDCNKKIDEIVTEIPGKSLSLAVVDPTGLHIKFDTLQKLTKDRRIDLVITYPEGMDIKRNLSKYIKRPHSILDDYIGDKDWRLLFPKNIKDINQMTSANIEKNLIDHYKKNLTKLSYKEIKSGDEILIKSSQKRLPLYYLLFASKHPLGYKFWKEISKITPTGQIKLSLNNTSDFLYESLAVYHAVKPRIIYKEFELLDGREEKLVERVNDGSIITRFDKTPLPKNLTDVVCPHFLELKWAYGCPFDCSWCYLKGTFRFRPNGKEPVIKDYAKIELHTKTFLEEVKTPEVLNTGEIADSLMSENAGTPFSKFITPMFETQNLHRVLFLTKSINIKNLLDIKPHNQAIISFSLNAIPVAKMWEKKAPSVLKRIEAAKKVYQEGYEVRLRIDPMVPIGGWEESYLQLVDLIFENLVPERITLGSLRGLQSTINGCSDKSWVKYLRESSNWGKKIEFQTRFKMYSRVIEHLRSKHNYNKVALCKETMAMWNSLKMDYKKIKCNCIW
jgi:spore photoproduct lyase